MAKLIKTLFSKHLLATNMLMTNTLLSVGDAVIQTIEIRNSKDEVTEEFTQKRDWRRTGRMFTIGLVMGPVSHFWYNKCVDKIVTSTGIKGAVYRILADQAVAAPFFCTTFFFGTSMLEGRGIDGSIQEVKDKFITVYLIDWLVWPPAQFINFYFLPKEFRVVYVAGITLCWNTFLSWYKHRNVKHPNVEEKTHKA